MQGESWVADITTSLSTLGLYLYIALWERLQALTLDATTADKFLWKWTSSNQYMARFDMVLYLHPIVIVLVRDDISINNNASIMSL
jgi:hypothetical protein